MNGELERQAKEKAREYFRTKATPLPVSEVRARIAEPLRACDELVTPLSAAQAARATLPGEWTVHEIVDHLVETHGPSLEELRDLLAGRRPPGEPIPAGLQSRDPLARPWPELLTQLKRLQAEVVATLGAAPDSLTEARAPVVMVINVKEADGREAPLHWIEELDWKAYAIIFRLHVLDHLGQARKILRATGRR